MRTTAILPVKDFAGAKRRLAADLSPDERRALAEAMFRDVLAALGQSTMIDELLVVTGGSRAATIAMERCIRVLSDDERGHNAAALIGIDAALKSGAERALLIPGDCPALDPGEVDRLVARSAAAPSLLIVPDRHGTGTNALVLTPPDAVAPSFGPASRERHLSLARSAGVNAEVVEVPSLATDVDTPRDLEALGAELGPRASAANTVQLLRTLTVSSKC